MPVVKIVQPGFETYNGIMEGVRFENGVSVESMSQFSAERIGAFMKVVNADDGGEPLGMGYRMANAKTTGVAPREPLQFIARTKTGKTKEAVKKSKLISYDFTKAQLEGVADKEGILGLRKVADQYDVRGRSISEIIESLLAIKANQEAKDAAAAPAKKETSLLKNPSDESASGGIDDIDSLIEG